MPYIDLLRGSKMNMGKSGKFLCAILTLCILASTVIGVLSLVGQNKIQTKVNTLTEDGKDPEAEDGVEIMDEYKIVSTLPISDAYKSGDTSKLDDRQKETLDMAKEVIDKEITDKMNSYQKEKAIYKYLTTEMKSEEGILTVIPTTGEDSDNPYGVLKNHSAVCVGYATTFRLFMQMMNIECKVVHSTDLTHTWDLVKLGGDWYHTDCYMDADVGNFRQFNMNDTLCAVTHTWNQEYFPAANGTKYNPVIVGAQEIADIYAIPEWFSKNQAKEKETFSCTFKKDITSATEDSAAYIINTIVNGISSDVENKGSYEANWTKNDAGKYVLCIYFTKNTSEIELSDKDQKKADDALSKYYKDYIGFGSEGGYSGNCDNCG